MRRAYPAQARRGWHAVPAPAFVLARVFTAQVAGVAAYVRSRSLADASTSLADDSYFVVEAAVAGALPD